MKSPLNVAWPNKLPVQDKSNLLGCKPKEKPILTGETKETKEHCTPAACFKEHCTPAT